MVKTQGSIAVAFFALAACSADEHPLTQLILVADTDVEAVRTIRFNVVSDDASEMQTAEAAHAPGAGASYVSVVQDDGPSNIAITASGLDAAGQVLLTRTHRVSFVARRTREVRLDLYASCVATRAPACELATQTCANGQCVSQQLDAASLPPWSGPSPATASDAGTEVDASLDANVRDASSVDAQVVLTACGDAGSYNLQTDLAHCGACTNACVTTIPPNFHATVSCSSGACAYACASGYGDCDGKKDNGCEEDLNMQNRNCGVCGNMCAKGSMCMMGTCSTMP